MIEAEYRCDNPEALLRAARGTRMLSIDVYRRLIPGRNGMICGYFRPTQKAG